MATLWTLESFSFNDGPDGEGVSWWADVPRGWNAPTAATQLVDRQTASGALLVGARQAARTLQITAQVIAPDNSAMWAAVNNLETFVEGLIFTAATITVQEPQGDVAMGVRYREGFVPRIDSPRSFSFVLPLVAIDPTKTVTTALEYNEGTYNSGSYQG